MNALHRSSADKFGICLWLLLVSVFGLGACDGSNSGTPPPAALPAQEPMTVAGVVSDGPVTGGTIFVFTGNQVLSALAGVDPDGDRLASLAAADSIASLTRDPDGDAGYSLTVPGEFSGFPVFLVFDNTDAVDDRHKDTPPNLESVAILGEAGTTRRVNLSMQTTLVARLVRARLDPDGDGAAIGAAAIQDEIDAATGSVLGAFATDALGRDLYPVDFDPFTHDDDAATHRASDVIGFLVRAAAAATGTDPDDIVSALAADAADGAFDGAIPVDLAPAPDQEALAAAVAELHSASGDDELDAFSAGPCSSAAVAMAKACAADVLDDLFAATAICQDIADDADRADCRTDAGLQKAESEEECADVLDARMELCEDRADAAHDPMFGPDFATRFVDPRQIGAAVQPNPWFPLVSGNRWIYEGDGEVIEVMVTEQTKLIDGISCVVVIDTVSEDGAPLEITRDWYAQDVGGNVWYCGEISRNFEIFDGDDPATPELVDIDGSWKAGRDGSEAGVLLPFAPTVGETIRQEVAYGEAEDVVRIESTAATEAAPGGACAGNCLLTTDFTPLEPDAEENKYYAPGIGLIVETNPATGERVELMEFTSAP